MPKSKIPANAPAPVVESGIPANTPIVGLTPAEFALVQDYATCDCCGGVLDCDVEPPQDPDNPGLSTYYRLSGGHLAGGSKGMGFFKPHASAPPMTEDSVLDDLASTDDWEPGSEWTLCWPCYEGAFKAIQGFFETRRKQVRG